MKKAILFTFCIFFFVIGICNAQWTLQYGETNVTLYSIYFIDQNLGWSTGWLQQSYGKVTKTTNGGLNWYSQSIATQYPFSLFFINQYIGWVVGGTGGSTPPVVKTTDGGITWVNIYIPGMYNDLYSVFFINRDTGWAVGSSQRIIKTTNGGLNWIIQHGGSYYFSSLKSVYFIDQYKGWCVGGDLTYKDTILSTTNGGVSWIGQPSVTSNELESVYFINQNTGWSVGFNGTVLKTTNSGLNWNFQTIGNYRLTSVFFANQNIGWISGLNSAGLIYITSNGGANWFIQYSGGFDLYSVHFINQNTAWAAGYGGHILRTTNGGGIVGIQNISSEIPNQYYISQNYPNPFNPTTKIRFALPKNSFVKIAVYDAIGRETTTLVNEQHKQGTYEVDFDGTNFASGIYFYVMKTESFIDSKKMVLVK